MLAAFPLDEPLLVASEVPDPTEDDDNNETPDDGTEALLDSGPDEDRPPLLLEETPPEEEPERDWADEDVSEVLLDVRMDELLPRDPPDVDPPLPPLLLLLLLELLEVLEVLELDWDTGTPWSEQKFPSVPCMQR